MLHPYLQAIQDAIPSTWSSAEREKIERHLHTFHRYHEGVLSWGGLYAPLSAETQELLAEIDRVFAEVKGLDEPELLLHVGLGDGCTHVDDFLLQHEIVDDWRKIPLTLLAGPVFFSHLGSPHAVLYLLPAYLKAHCLYPYSVDTSSLLSYIEDNAAADSARYSLLNAEQRALVVRIVNRERQAGSVSNLTGLLPWEMELYLEQEQYTRPAVWLRHHYPDAAIPELIADERISRIRAAIPEDWDSYDREQLEYVLDWLEHALQEFNQKESDQKENEEHLELDEQSARLIQRIEQAFDGVSDEGERVLLLGGLAKDEYMGDAEIDLLSRFEYRGDWRDIPPDWLYACDCALSYMNAVGYRYLVPAFLRAELQTKLSQDMVISLGSRLESTHAYHLEQVSLFTPEQRAVLVDYMNYFRSTHSVVLRMGLLLPWEMSDYLAHQDSYESMTEWLLAQYPELEQDASIKEF